MRSVVIAIAALALLTVGGMVFIQYVTRDVDAVSPGAAGAAATLRAQPAPDSSYLEPPPTDLPNPSLPPPAPPPSAPRIKAEPGTWAAVPAASRLKALGANAAPVGQGLSELAPIFAACYGADVAKMDESNELPTLVLSLESRAGAIVVVDAAPLAQGGATDQLFACAVNAVKGRSFPAPGAKPGQRQRLIHPVRP